jgi:uncharacterized protein YhfF
MSSGNLKLTYKEAFAFGDSKEMADDLAQLVINGQKQATTSALALLELDKEPLPQIGDYSIVLNADEKPLAIIKTTKVDILPFNKVTAEYAEKEGEGDKSLSYWREGHNAFFTREYKRYGLEFNEDAPVVCEEFECIYREIFTKS